MILDGELTDGDTCLLIMKAAMKEKRQQANLPTA